MRDGGSGAKTKQDAAASGKPKSNISHRLPRVTLAPWIQQLAVVFYDEEEEAEEESSLEPVPVDGVTDEQDVVRRLAVSRNRRVWRAVRRQCQPLRRSLHDAGSQVRRRRPPTRQRRRRQSPALS